MKGGLFVLPKNFIDSYNMIITLDNGEIIWTERHNNISLSDFEIMYGNITAKILKLDLYHITLD